MLELEQWGAVFDRTPDGLIMQRPFGGHTYRRLNHVGDRTGLELIRTLQDKAVSVGMKCYMETTMTRLLKDGDRVVGAFGYYRESGRFFAIKAKAVVLATGGWGRMYKVTSNSWESTGDGAVLAFNAGAELMGMEMVQFHPTGMVWPPGVRGLLVTEGVRGEGGILRNGKGERFMFDPKYMTAALQRPLCRNRRRGRALARRQGQQPAASRTAAARRGRTGHLPRGAGGQRHRARRASTSTSRTGAPTSSSASCPACGSSSTHWVTWTSPSSRWRSTRPSTTRWVGCGPSRRPAATNVPGLYAAGESCGGRARREPPGRQRAVRPPGVRQACGRGGSRVRSARSSTGTIDEAEIQAEAADLLAPFESPGKENPYLLTQELQDAMQEGAMIARTEEGLQKCLDKVMELQERARNLHIEGARIYNPGLAHDPRHPEHAQSVGDHRALRHRAPRKPRRAVAHRLPRP